MVSSDNNLPDFKKGQGTGGFKRSFVNKKWGEEDRWDKGVERGDDDRDRRDRFDHRKKEDEKDEKIFVKEGSLIKKDNNTEFRQIIKDETEQSTKVAKAPWSKK